MRFLLEKRYVFEWKGMMRFLLEKRYLKTSVLFLFALFDIIGNSGDEIMLC